MILELRRKHKVSLLIEIAGLPRSSYYYHAKNVEKGDKYASVKEAILSIWKEHRGRMGYRRITVTLRNQGIHINHKTVLKLMRQLGLFCKVRCKRYSSYRGEIGQAAPNLLNRKFHANKPNEKWVTDVTEFHLHGQKLYLSPILDLYNQEIISYSISHSPRLSQVMDMLEKAFDTIPDDTNLILHSDQGWQYRLNSYQCRLKAKGIRQSMSRKGNCLDNAVIENFFGILKSELLYLQEFDSMEQFKCELVDYLEYYNNRRIKLKLKGMSPVHFRIHTLLSA